MALSLNHLPWYGQVGIFLAVSVVGLVGFHYGYAQPMQAQLAEREGTLQQLRADIATGQATAARLPEFQAEVEDLERRLEALRAVLPEQKDVGDLLRRLQTLATQSNLQIRGFRPQPIVTHELHAEWPIVLELDGTYHNLGLFFDRISRFSRIINISNLTVSAKDEQTANSTILAECRATTFVLLDRPAAAAPDAVTP